MKECQILQNFQACALASVRILREWNCCTVTVCKICTNFEFKFAANTKKERIQSLSL